MTDTPASLGLLGRLPLELREKIYFYALYPLPYQSRQDFESRSTKHHLDARIPKCLKFDPQVQKESIEVLVRTGFLSCVFGLRSLFGKDLYPGANYAYLRNLNMTATATFLFDREGKWSINLLNNEKPLFDKPAVTKLRENLPNLRCLALRLDGYMHVNNGSIGSRADLLDCLPILLLLTEVLIALTKDIPTVLLCWRDAPEMTAYDDIIRWKFMLDGIVMSTQHVGFLPIGVGANIYRINFDLTPLLKEQLMEGLALTEPKKKIEVVSEASETLEVVRQRSWLF